MDNVFGDAVTKGDVVRATLETLSKWAPTYCAWRSRASGLTVPPPRRFLALRDMDNLPRVDPPLVLVACSGVADAPTKGSRRTYRATWAVGLLGIVTGRDRDDTDAVCEEMGAALRALLVHKGSLGGFAEGTEWLDERYDALPDRDRRQLAAVRLEFSVDVREVLSGTGPAMPNPTTPIPDRPTVREDGAEVEVRAEDM